MAYNGFLTTPVITQVGGPVSRIVVTPGEHVTAGQPLLYVTSPDYSLLRSAYIKARDAFQLADKFYKRAQDLYAHQAIAQADLEQAESTRTQAEADLQSSEQAIRILGISESGKRRDRTAVGGSCRCWRRWREKSWSGSARRGNCCRPAERSASRFRT